MTQNQKNLITFIHKYQAENDGMIPSLIKIVKGIGVSDNKSALRVIESAVRDGYLAQVGVKASLVTPTYKALKELGLQPLEKYIKTQQLPELKNDLSSNATATLKTDIVYPPSGTQTKLRDNISLNTVTTLKTDIASPPKNAQGIENRIKGDGTEFDSNTEPNTVHSYVNSPLVDIFKTIPLNKQSAERAALTVFLLGFSVLFFGPTPMAILATSVFLQSLTNNQK